MPLTLPFTEHEITIDDCYWLYDGTTWAKFDSCPSGCNCIGVAPASAGDLGERRVCTCDCNPGSSLQSSQPKTMRFQAKHDCMKDVLYRVAADASGSINNASLTVHLRRAGLDPRGHSYIGPDPTVDVDLGDSFGSLTLKSTDYDDICKAILDAGNAFERSARANQVGFLLFD
ncbi:MAG TPA: hypothetical protein DDW52_21830 [Planctomycetaceae bacterium]|nr:hypothetical protein [Planctomycetaceae bacterium]